mmetsp:Transcript_16281/g.63464  ORF Transcript_16281/g.63464 Transcript_16281/m.63464 type:complete len:267 (-) Transcript_16281:344-1144(-)
MNWPRCWNAEFRTHLDESTTSLLKILASSMRPSADTTVVTGITASEQALRTPQISSDVKRTKMGSRVAVATSWETRAQTLPRAMAAALRTRNMGSAESRCSCSTVKVSTSSWGRQAAVPLSSSPASILCSSSDLSLASFSMMGKRKLLSVSLSRSLHSSTREVAAEARTCECSSKTSCSRTGWTVPCMISFFSSPIAAKTKVENSASCSASAWRMTASGSSLRFTISGRMCSIVSSVPICVAISDSSRTRWSLWRMRSLLQYFCSL